MAYTTSSGHPAETAVSLRDEEATDAAWEAGRGAVVGSTKWGVGAAILAAAGHSISPMYRGLTFQFKVFIQMSAMIMGGMLEADSRLREHEARIRVQKKLGIGLDKASWEKYEQDVRAEKARIIARQNEEK
ncbi:hypothetical protein V492_00985 [Pseudogymnoascus sp. VKM F-4246]|nr:hypothetical protein V492_00985 [Pseudogymnoascus sp. VKM F-4246]